MNEDKKEQLNTDILEQNKLIEQYSSTIKVLKSKVRKIEDDLEKLNSENVDLGYEELKSGHYKIYSIQGFLKIKDHIQKKDNHKLFYRGVSQESYATNDTPGIFRSIKKGSQKSWVSEEAQMFYELISEHPKAFEKCTTTFEHLVVMQHYEYPTRLLDITSNPLVALYFACDGFNTLKGKEVNENEDGQLIAYNINLNDIRNHESDRVTLLSNLSIASNKLTFEYFLLNEIQHLTEKAIHLKVSMRKWFSDMNLKRKNLKPEPKMTPEDLRILEAFKDTDKTQIIPLNYAISTIFSETSSLIEQLDTLIKFRKKEKETLIDLEENDKSKFKERTDFLQGIRDILVNLKELNATKEIDSTPDIAEVYLNSLANLTLVRRNLFTAPYFSRYCYKVSGEKPSFNSLLIQSNDIKQVQCVLPKKDNPRIQAQQGAFLLFGFAEEGYQKLTPPKIPDAMYAKQQNTSNINIKISISKRHKETILQELAELGISNATLFPEIDVIANTVKDRYRALN